MSFDVIIRQLWCCYIVCCCFYMTCEGKLLVHFDSAHFSKEHQSVKQLKYCKNCPSAKDEGSMMPALIAKHAPKVFDVTGMLVYSLPNHAESNPLNQFDVKDNIAFVDRGKISLIEKVTILQRAGAIAVVIADTGQCDPAFKSCGSRIGSASDGGLSAYDSPDVWSDIDIPVVIVTKAMAEKLRKLMEVKRRKFPKLGFQMVNIIDEEDEEEEEEDEEHDEL